MRLGGDKGLPATRELAYATLRGGNEVAIHAGLDLAAAAGTELDAKLGITERRLVRDRITE